MTGPQEYHTVGLVTRNYQIACIGKLARQLHDWTLVTASLQHRQASFHAKAVMRWCDAVMKRNHASIDDYGWQEIKMMNMNIENLMIKPWVALF